MTERAIRAWTTWQSADVPALAPFVSTVYMLPIPLRKVLLTGCRIQSRHIHDTSRIYSRYRSEWTTLIPYPNDRLATSDTRITLRMFYEYHVQLFSDPILAGFASMVLRFLPYSSYESMHQVRTDTIKKELSAAVSVYHPVTFTYRNLFGSPMQKSLPMTGDYGRGNPQLNATIASSLKRAARDLAPRTLYPKTSTRTIMSHPYEAAYEPFSKRLRQPRRITSTRDIEEVYFRTGWKLSGLTEVRTSWKGNDLKPRVYYARGATHHFSSSIVQQIFNKLVDALPNTNRRNRFNLYDLEMMTPDMTLMIYDYSSFTSTLHEIRNFTSKLADFLRGLKVTVVDSHNGPHERDIGNILDEYNQVCNIEAEFDVSQLMEITELVLEHNCGMLGIPGNISSCTLLHGIHLAIILDSLHRGKVIGDDAIGIYVDDEDMERETMVEALSAIGILEYSKVEFWRDSDEDEDTRWNYEKRPFGRVHERVYKGSLTVWPSINLSMGIINPFHRSLHLSRPQLFKRACRQWSRFHAHLNEEVSEECQAIILHLYRQFFRYWDIESSKKDTGYIGRYEIDGQEVEIILPPCSKEFFTVRSIDFLRSQFGYLVRIPQDDPHEKTDSIHIASTFSAHGTPLLSFLRDMDVLEMKELAEYRLMEDCSDDLLEDLLMGQLRFIYAVTLLEEPPDWSLNELERYVDAS